jgi:hypothetical protein
MTLLSCTKGPVWESEEGRTLSGFRLGLSALRDCLTRHNHSQRTPLVPLLVSALVGP